MCLGETAAHATIKHRKTLAGTRCSPGRRSGGASTQTGSRTRRSHRPRTRCRLPLPPGCWFGSGGPGAGQHGPPLPSLPPHPYRDQRCCPLPAPKNGQRFGGTPGKALTSVWQLRRSHSILPILPQSRGWVKVSANKSCVREDILNLSGRFCTFSHF